MWHRAGQKAAQPPVTPPRVMGTRVAPVLEDIDLRPPGPPLQPAEEAGTSAAGGGRALPPRARDHSARFRRTRTLNSIALPRTK